MKKIEKSGCDEWGMSWDDRRKIDKAGYFDVCRCGHWRVEHIEGEGHSCHSCECSRFEKERVEEEEE